MTSSTFSIAALALVAMTGMGAMALAGDQPSIHNAAAAAETQPTARIELPGEGADMPTLERARVRLQSRIDATRQKFEEAAHQNGERPRLFVEMKLHQLDELRLLQQQKAMELQNLLAIQAQTDRVPATLEQLKAADSTMRKMARTREQLMEGLANIEAKFGKGAPEGDDARDALRETTKKIVDYADVLGKRYFIVQGPAGPTLCSRDLSVLEAQLTALKKVEGDLKDDIGSFGKAAVALEKLHEELAADEADLALVKSRIEAATKQK